MIYLFRKYWQEICVALLAAIFFAAASWFININQTPDFMKWGSPDETANYTFAKLYAETGELAFFEKYNPLADDIIHPRSMRSDFGVVKPVSFLGIILVYGALAKHISFDIFPYLTPFFGALGIFFFYLLIRKIFGRANAFLSVFLLAALPPYFFYSARGFFHNILFISLLIIGLYFLTTAISRPAEKNSFFSKSFLKMDWLNFLLAALGGYAIGLALLARASEALWLLPALFVLWLFNIRRSGFLKLILIISFAASAFLPQIYWNKVLYGGYFSGGYAEMNKSILTIASSGGSLALTAKSGNFSGAIAALKKIKASVFYFGYRPDQAWKNFNLYYIKMFPLFFWPAVFGLILFLTRVGQWRKKYWAYLLAYLALGFILMMYYGSWNFHDNPDPKEISLGNSYTRYWLPIYLGAIPFAALFILRFTWALFAKKEDEAAEIFVSVEGGKGRRKFFFGAPSRKFFANAARAIIVIFVFYFSANFILTGSKEGLIYCSINRAVSLAEYRQVLSATEANSAIITQYHDKIFFPARRVIVGLFSEPSLNERYARLAARIPVYYYNFSLSSADLDFLNKQKLGVFGLRIEYVKKINSVFSLYKLKLIQPPQN